jgi:hypothetical protein
MIAEWVTLAADADTPVPPPRPAGTLIGVPAGEVIPPRGFLAGIPGWGRGVPRTIVLGFTPPPTQADKLQQFVDSVPGPGGWHDAAARATWEQAVVFLGNQGLTRNAIRTQVPALYAAAVANYSAGIV